jgi:hypothetical protein
LILERVYAPRPIPLERLYQVCCSLPLVAHSANQLSWDDCSGGSLKIRDLNNHRWADRYYYIPGGELSDLVTGADPYHIPHIQQLRYEQPQTPTVPAVVRLTDDCFFRLSYEIIIIVASYLPTVDALNVRYVSGSFTPIFYDRHFWASRFKSGAERSWVFEVHSWDKTCDLRWIYRQTSEKNSTVRTENRQRVLKLAQRAKKVLDLQWDDSHDLAVHSQTGLTWREAAGYLLPMVPTRLTRRHGESCQCFHEQQVSIDPGQLSHITFSSVQLGDHTYIAGMRLTLSQNPAVQLGYRTDNEFMVPIKCLTGFNVAVWPRGIRAIQCVCHEQSQSLWVGHMQGAPTTMRLLTSSPITVIKAGFDVSLRGFPIRRS